MTLVPIRIFRPGVVCALLLQFAAGIGMAEARREPVFVSTIWLAERVNDPALVLLHAGETTEFGAEHLPGARLITLREVSTPPGQGLTLQIPALDQLQSVFEKKGITDDSRIVVYSSGDSLTGAARVFLTLEYFGLGGQTSLLDGGLRAWKAEGRQVTSEVRTPAAGKLTPKPNPDVIAGIDWLSANLKNPNVAIIDARTAEFYEGTSAGRMPRPGHIPGALHIPFTALTDSSGKLRSREALEEMFRSSGVKSGQLVVAYCHVGQQASFLYWVARYLGYDARLYDGSWEEWSARADLPAVTGPAPGTPPEGESQE
jgi:thiosulfate/3-mercaptopyruvate sulfurtransferase